MKTWIKGLIIGFIITFVLILISSYSAPARNYDLAKLQYEGYNTVIQNCGSNPSDECVKNLCGGRSDSFCEGVYRQSLDEQYTGSWQDYVRTEKPDIRILLIPNIKDGLESFLMFGPFGLLILITPIVIGIIIGWIIGKVRR